MKNITQWLVVTGVAVAMLASAGNAMAQQDGERGGRRGQGGGPGGGGGNFDPAQMQQRMMERYRERLEVKDDAEWNVLSGLIRNVAEARRDLATTGGGMGGFGRPGGGGGPGGGGRGGFGGETDPAQEALAKAIENKASKDELKSAMAKARASRKEKETKLAKAQEDLKKVLSTEQEAVALSMGLVQ